MWSLLIAFFLFGTARAILDGNCTAGGAYAPNAVSCPNVYSDATCLQIYLNDTAVTAGGTDERPSNCFNGTNGQPSADLKAAAIASCPKLCGFCCQTPAYACNNAPYPRINCATVTNSMCQSTQWRSIIASDCPNTCGFCLLGGCIDSAPDCATQPTICVTNGMEAFVAANCQRTCNLCSGSTTAASAAAASSSTSCVDSNTNCANWVTNGFCTSTFYTTAQKQSYCAKSCGLCSGKK